MTTTRAEREHPSRLFPHPVRRRYPPHDRSGHYCWVTWRDRDFETEVNWSARVVLWAVVGGLPLMLAIALGAPRQLSLGIWAIYVVFLVWYTFWGSRKR
jgi:hypothetical protein